jgi:hypothetical protein
MKKADTSNIRTEDLNVVSETSVEVSLPELGWQF